jgi:GTP-binding protein Era
VPDPAFPFLGVHATRGVDGSVHVGPNAVLALAREGYDWRTLKVRELAGTLTDPGFLALAAKQWRYGLGEMHRSLSKAAMAKAVAKMLPGTTSDDLVPPHDVMRRAGVRARRGALGAPRAERTLARRDGRAAHRPGDRLPARGQGCLGRRSRVTTTWDENFRSGFACFVGRPNVGKSTLTNALVGQKVAITSSRPQTTRHAIRGIVHREDGQLVLVDTPGLHKPRTLLGERLNDVVRTTWAEVDVVGFCVPADQQVGPGDKFIVNELRKIADRTPLVGVLTKTDLVKRDVVAERLLELSALAEFTEIVPVSATRGDQVSLLADLLLAQMPLGPPLYPEGDLSDEPESTMIAEFVREAALEGVRDELPHSLAVVVEELEEGRTLKIRAEIFVERQSQKAIVIGRGGSRLKEVGTNARQQIEKMLGTKVHLELFVKVAKDWQRDPRQLRKLGF